MTFLKKLGCVLTASAFLSCFCIPSAAAELNSESDSSSVDVTAKYSAATATDIYSVNIEWGSMAFEYKEESRVWNPETHKYDVTGTSPWSCADGANEVKVTNHSNNPVTVELSYTPAADYSTITGEFDVPSKTLESAENSAPESAPSFTSSLSLSGELPQNVASSAVIGSAKVTLKSGENGGGGGDQTQLKSYINITSSLAEHTAYSFTAPIIYQGDNKYTAEIYAESVLTPSQNPKCEFSINGTPYYIYEESVGTALTVENPVTVSTSFWDDGSGRPKRRAIIIEANKRYLLTITLESDGKKGTAELEEIGS